MTKIYTACYVDNASGYGQQNCEFISGFLKAGITTTVLATGLSEKYAAIPSEIKACITRKADLTAPEFLVQPPSYKPFEKTERVWFLVWESTRLKPEWIARLNKCNALITASDWNASCFSANGITVPIYRIPLFVRPEFQYTPSVDQDVYTFGCSGKTSGQTPRKNISTVMAAFTQGLQDIDDARLKIKIGGSDKLEEPSDPRISIIKGHLPTQQMAEWYASLDVFVHASKSEGWGFQPLQAMAVGRPVIACRFGGVAEYFNEDYGLEVDYTHQPAQGMYTSLGNWAEPDLNDLMAKMRYAYNHAGEMRQKGLCASRRALCFPPEKTTSKLIALLERYKIIV